MKSLSTYCEGLLGNVRVGKDVLISQWLEKVSNQFIKDGDSVMPLRNTCIVDAEIPNYIDIQNLEHTRFIIRGVHTNFGFLNNKSALSLTFENINVGSSKFPSLNNVTVRDYIKFVGCKFKDFEKSNIHYEESSQFDIIFERSSIDSLERFKN